MSDPFDQTGVNSNPDIWNNLLNFGLATMSAGATPGATTLGALGRGGMAAMQSSRENNQLRMQNQIGSQDLYGKQLGNAQAYTQAQLQNARMQAAGMPTTPLPPLPGMNAQSPYQSVQPTPSPTAQASWTPNAGMSTPQGGQRAELTGGSSGGGTPATQQSSAGILSNGLSNPMDTGGHLSSNDVYRISLNPSLLGQLSPQQAMDYTNIAPSLGIKVPEEFSKLAYAGATSKATEEGAEPAKIREARAQYRELPGARGLPGAIYDPTAQGGQGGIVAEGAQMGVIPAGQPGAGAQYRLPPSVVGQQGTSQQSTAPAQSQGTGADPGIQISGNAPPMPPGANAFSNMPSQPGSGIAPTTDAVTTAFKQQNPVAPQSSQSNMALPNGAVMTELPPQEGELLKEGAKDMMDEDRKGYEAAQQTLASTAVIDQNIDRLGNTGWYAPGAGASERVAVAKGIQSGLNAIGLNGSSLMPDPSKISTAEELNKTTTNLGFTLARSMGSREAASVVEQAIKINPGLSTSYLGGKMVNNLIAETAQRQKDMYEFKLNAIHEGIDPATAQMQFNKQYPGAGYVRRAMSQYAPIQLSPSMPGAMKNLLPGTVIRLQNDTGPGKVIPFQQDYPFSVPPTLQNTQGAPQ